MANLKRAFEIPINPENKDFVQYPYTPYQRIIGNMDTNNKQLIDPHLLTIPRCFDIKHGTKNCAQLPLPLPPPYVYTQTYNQ